MMQEDADFRQLSSHDALMDAIGALSAEEYESMAQEYFTNSKHAVALRRMAEIAREIEGV